MNPILREEWRLASSGVSLDAGHIRIRLEGGRDDPDRAALAAALVEMPSAIVCLERAWAILLADKKADPPTLRVRDEIAAVLKRIGGRP